MSLSSRLSALGSRLVAPSAGPLQPACDANTAPPRPALNLRDPGAAAAAGECMSGVIEPQPRAMD
jgi:hypothetical protein